MHPSHAIPGTGLGQLIVRAGPKAGALEVGWTVGASPPGPPGCPGLPISGFTAYPQKSGTTVIVSKCVRASSKTLGDQGSDGRPPGRRAARYSSSERGRLHLHGPTGLSVPL